MAKEVAAITGGTQGVGKGLVERFCRDGYEVVFCGRNEEAGNKIAGDTGAMFIKADVSNQESVEAFFGKINESFGRLDVLINNAAVVSAFGKTCDIPMEEYHKIMDINMTGSWLVLRTGVKLIVDSGRGGRVVNVGSQAGLSGSPAQMGGCSHYGTSKAALHGLTKIMALEYAPNKIRVNAVAPTAIETNLVKDFLASMTAAGKKDEALQTLAKTNPLVGPGENIMQVEDVTGVIAFLCGSESKFINGAIIPIDGGYSCM